MYQYTIFFSMLPLQSYCKGTRRDRGVEEKRKTSAGTRVQGKKGTGSM